MLLLGCKPRGRHTEQHDVFFAIGSSLKDLIPEIKKFWPEVGSQIHIDAWREVNAVDDYLIRVVEREGDVDSTTPQPQLFFINLGGYQRNVFDEAHYRVLTVQADKAGAFANAKKTEFYKQIGYKGAPSHIDDKYGIDVDDLYQIEDVLPASQKAKYQIEITKGAADNPDEIHLGYFRLEKL